MIDVEKVSKLIDKAKVSIISSVDGEGFPNTKAMLKPRIRNGLREFYFSTNTSSNRVSQYEKNSKACIYFYYKGKIKYEGVMLKGIMEVLKDQEIKDKVWKKYDYLFYRKGKTDPDYCVLKFTAESGRYYCDLETESFDIE